MCRYLILMAECETELREKVVEWKAGMEVKCLRMNTGKTKVMLSDPKTVTIDERGKWPCGVCKKGVGNNLIMCTLSEVGP